MGVVILTKILICDIGFKILIFKTRFERFRVTDRYSIYSYRLRSESKSYLHKGVYIHCTHVHYKEQSHYARH